MSSNSFGKIFTITTFGESHGKGIGVIIDGCPAGLEVDDDQIRHDLARRRPGQSKLVTARDEKDGYEIISGVYQGITTGSPIAIIITNTDQRPKDYEHIQSTYRPSHSDYTYDQKYGLRDHRGGGRSSARETACRVAAGAIAKMLLKTLGVTIAAGVTQVGQLRLAANIEDLAWDTVEDNLVRCPDPLLATQMVKLIEDTKAEGDTLGGQVSCVINNCPIGLGEPVYDKLQADLAKAMMGINAVKGFEYGSGFSGISMKGSVHNDQWKSTEGKISTKTNYSGGIQGGISNGMPIYFNVAFKPVSTIMQSQATISKDGKIEQSAPRGRHDPCVVPRAVPIVEAMAALVLADHYLRHRSSRL